jgi:hypothetical protein
MADLLSELKSRLIDQIYTPRAVLIQRDPFETIAVHTAVSNQLWWMHSGWELPPRPASPSAKHPVESLLPRRRR